jgi:hypothetical protein
MSNIPAVTGTQLTNALRALGIKFILGGKLDGEALGREPVRLIAGLASSDEARLRLALIPLFLEHPEFAVHVRAVAASLDASARLTLQCYYSAAVWLQQEFRGLLKTSRLGQADSLPDYFSRELGIRQAADDDPEVRLRMLAERQRILSGERINWVGTYRHAAQLWLKGLDIQDA